MPQIPTQNSAAFFKVIINLFASGQFPEPLSDSFWLFCPVYICFVGRESDGIFGITGVPPVRFVRSGIWFYPTYNACYCLMDSGRRRKTPGSEKNVLLLMTQEAALFSAYLQWFLLLRSPLGVAWGPSRCYTCGGSVSHLRNTEFKESTTLRASSQLACSLWRATLPHISWLPTVNTALRNGSGKW